MDATYQGMPSNDEFTLIINDFVSKKKCKNLVVENCKISMNGGSRDHPPICTIYANYLQMELNCSSI